MTAESVSIEQWWKDYPLLATEVCFLDIRTADGNFVLPVKFPHYAILSCSEMESWRSLIIDGCGADRLSSDGIPDYAIGRVMDAKRLVAESMMLDVWKRCACEECSDVR